ncbi:hypothetical protein [Entomohabitans teleogrylli]|uniref:hypothetical protein n=1 Tax=Entomohabitans teleogrylli TaxID=1384589 RepID=UPI00073D1E50|nr:hypothetical protein [Entomohabitans teleogrylli]
MFILQDLFTGWRAGTFGRVKFFIYFLVLAVNVWLGVQVIWLTYFVNNWLLQWLFWLTVVLNYYCGLLLYIKRLRQLVAYPVPWALGCWILTILFQRFPWSHEQYWLRMGISLVNLVMLCLLLFSPARRFTAPVKTAASS